MGAAVEHVEARDRKDPSRSPAQVAIQRHSDAGSCRPGRGQRDGEDGVGAKVLLVWSSIEIEHPLIDRLLTRCVGADQCGCDGAIDVLDGPLHALSAVAVAAVPKLVGFECPR